MTDSSFSNDPGRDLNGDSGNSQHGPEGREDLFRSLLQNSQTAIFKELVTRAHARDPESMRQYGTFLLQRAEEPEHLQKAVMWIKRAARASDIVAIHILAALYENGLGVKKDILQATRFHREAAESRFSPSMVALGSIYVQGKLGKVDLKKGLYWLEMACKWENPDGQYLLGEFYERGLRGEVDISKAEYWYKRAAGYDHPGALFRLGAIANLRTPLCSESRDYWLESANLGHQLSMYNLGAWHFNKAQRGDSYDISESLSESYDWFARTGEAGLAEGYGKLALLCFLGVYGPEKESSAEEWAKKGAEQNDGISKTVLSIIRALNKPDLPTNLL